ncbi:3888_t:CDS:1, partial [Ambispora leptoticha]
MTIVYEYIDLEKETYNITDYTEEQDLDMMREIIVTIQEYLEEEEEEEKLEK